MSRDEVHWHIIVLAEGFELGDPVCLCCWYMMIQIGAESSYMWLDRQPGMKD